MLRVDLFPFLFIIVNIKIEIYNGLSMCKLYLKSSEKEISILCCLTSLPLALSAV